MAERIQVTGVVTKCQLYSDHSRDRAWGREDLYDIKLQITLQTEEGPVYFFTPAARHSINNGGPIYVSTVEVNDWIDKKHWETKGFGDAAGCGQTPVSKINIGDVLTVAGSFKKNLGSGRCINRVKLVKKE